MLQKPFIRIKTVHKCLEAMVSVSLHNSCLQSPDWNGLWTSNLWLLDKNRPNRQIIFPFSWIQKMANFFTVLRTFSKMTLACLGKGRLVNDRTSHMDLDSGFLLNWSAHNSVIVSAAGIFRETGWAQPPPAHCYLSPHSVGWGNNESPDFGFKRRWLRPRWLNWWNRPVSARNVSHFSRVQTACTVNINVDSGRLQMQISWL